MVETMEGSVDAAESLHWQVESEVERERRKIRNREYMRRRRADPQFRKNEKRRREMERDQAFLQSATAVGGAAAGRKTLGQRCWICRKRAAVEVITRLRPTAEARSGFVQVRVAYCGFC
jgi:hypothetical protein